MQRRHQMNNFSKCLSNFSRNFITDVTLVEKYVVVMISYFEASWLIVRNACDAYYSINFQTYAFEVVIAGGNAALEHIQVVSNGFKEVNRLHFQMLARTSKMHNYAIEMMKRIRHFATNIMGDTPIYELGWKKSTPPENIDSELLT